MANTRWMLETRDGLTLVRATPLAGIAGVEHAFSTRRADDGDFDLGPASASGSPWDGRRGRLARAAGLAGRRLLAPRQVHGARTVEPPDFAQGPPPEADAVVARRDQAALAAAAVRTADCLPVLLAACDGTAVAAVHAGWRGTAASIVAVAVRRLAESGIAPGRLVAGLGPAIGPCCYEVGDDVVDAVARASGTAAGAVSRRDPGARPRLDLAGANRRQLERAGLARDAIATCPWCTRCRPDLFWSWRRDGAAAGRMMACIGWAPAAP